MRCAPPWAPTSPCPPASARFLQSAVLLAVLLRENMMRHSSRLDSVQLRSSALAARQAISTPRLYSLTHVTCKRLCSHQVVAQQTSKHGSLCSDRTEEVADVQLLPSRPTPMPAVLSTTSCSNIDPAERLNHTFLACRARTEEVTPEQIAAVKAKIAEADARAARQTLRRVPLGYDRHWNRFWALGSLPNGPPGLFCSAELRS